MALVSLATRTARGQIAAEQLLLLYNSSSQASADLARHYASARRVPADHLLGLPMALSADMDRAEYDEAAARLREALTRAAWGEQVRVVVTFYDVPLRVRGKTPTDAERRRHGEMQPVINQVLQQLNERVAELERSTGAPPSDDPPGLSLPDRLEALAQRYARARATRAGQVQAASGPARSAAEAALIECVAAVEGRLALLPLLQGPEGETEPQRREQMAQWLSSAQPVQARLAQARDAGPLSSDYDAAWREAVPWAGLLHAVSMLVEDAEGLVGTQSEAAVDSELSLVLRGAYNLYRWQPNDLADGAAAPPHLGPQRRTLMAARIDGPTPDVARRLIDDAIAVEAGGLRGSAYIDLRGLSGDDLYARYDQDLLDLYHLLRRCPDLSAVLDNRGEVFAPGSGPNAALYAGWYSAARYVPAFDFVRGAVAVHVASFEAVSLREGGKDYWCKGLLRDGAAATIGPVAEPYLHTFPRPSRFLGLLLTGRYSLVECYTRANPCLSWQMILIGDPLYRPFARNPQIGVEELETYFSRKAGPEAR